MVSSVKILGPDNHRILRGSGALKFFELERVPNSNWVRIFESLFKGSDDKAWVEGYCIVTNCPTRDIAVKLVQLQSKCEEANFIFRIQHPTI